MQTPPDAILNSGLQEILVVFEGFPDTPPGLTELSYLQHK
jgi:hypothetical protein